MGGERGDGLGLLALIGHDEVAPAAAAVGTAIPPQGGVAYHRPGLVLRGWIRVIFLPEFLLPK